MVSGGDTLIVSEGDTFMVGDQANPFKTASFLIQSSQGIDLCDLIQKLWFLRTVVYHTYKVVGYGPHKQWWELVGHV